MNKILSVCVVLILVGVSGRALAQASIGSYSGCKKLSGSARSACESCVGGGNFYQTKSKTCGMAPGMKKSKPLPQEKLPPRPKSMPKVSFATIPAGSFEIGARENEEGSTDKELFDSTVKITRSFQMQTTEVSQAEWYFIMGEMTPSWDKACGLGCAAGFVSWRQALEYLNALSKKEGLEQCYDLPTAEKVVWTKGPACTGYRLPTEAEWEYAARGGVEESRYGELDEIAWYYDNSNNEPAKGLAKKKPNAYGLYDMLGSQWEWAWDAEDYKPFAGKMSDPIAGGLEQEDLGTSRIVRGGSYLDSAIYLRAGHRHQYPASSGGKNHGFRPVRTIAKK